MRTRRVGQWPADSGPVSLSRRLTEECGGVDRSIIVALLLTLGLVVFALGIIFTRSFSLFVKGVFAVVIIALVPEVIDLLLAHFGSGEARATPASADQPKSGKANHDDVTSRSTTGLTRGTIAVLALVIFAVALFRLLQLQCPGAPKPAPSMTVLAASPTPSETTTGAPKTGPSATSSTGPSSLTPSASESVAPSPAGTVTDLCADNAQLLSTMLGASGSTVWSATWVH